MIPFNKMQGKIIGNRVRKTSEVLYSFKGAFDHLEDARKLQKRNSTTQEVEGHRKPTKPKSK